MKLYPALTPSLTTWLLAQPVFFIASAPRHGRHISLSPKGLAGSTLSVLSPTRIAYLDRGGSGVETVAHLYENGRATLLFVSFGPEPRILRLFCAGCRVVEALHDEAAFDGWLKAMGKPRPAAVRAVVVLNVFEVQTSCGFGVPRVRRDVWEAMVHKESKGVGAGVMDRGGDDNDDGPGERWTAPDSADLQFRNHLAVFEDRPTLGQYMVKQEQDGKVLSYRVEKNVRSLDGMPGLRVARRAAGEKLLIGDVQAYLKRVLQEKEGFAAGLVSTVLVYLFVRVAAASLF